MLIKLKAISVRQPFAWLIINGHKDVLDSLFYSEPLGMIAIHASQTFSEQGYKGIRERMPHLHMPPRDQFASGGIVGLADFHKTIIQHESYDSQWHSSQQFGFCLRNTRPTPFIKLPGQLGFFWVGIKQNIIDIYRGDAIVSLFLNGDTHPIPPLKGD